MKKRSLILILVFLMGFFNIQNVNAEVECLKTVNGAWCQAVPSESSCDPGFGVVTDPLQCEKVCCVGAEGECTSNILSAECVANGGVEVGFGACYNSEKAVDGRCEIGVCNLEGVNQRMTKAKCDYLAAQKGISVGSYNFGGGSEGVSKVSPSLGGDQGCCVDNEGCTIKKEGQCRISGGEFYAKKYCSDESLKDICPECQTVIESCSPDGGSILTKNSCEQILEVKQCGEYEFCDTRDGKLGCYSTDCVVGGMIYFPAVDIGGGKTMNPDSIPIDKNLLGGVERRKSGESWCMASGQVYGDDKSRETEVYFLPKQEAIAKYGDDIWKHSAGLSFDRFVCQNGLISLSQCGGPFRNEICVNNKELELVNSVEGLSEDFLFCNIFSGGLNIEAGLNIEISKFKSSSNFEEAQCVPNREDEIKGCRARYPKGSFFYKPETPNPNSKDTIQTSQCGKCGNGFWNVCGAEECRRLDDCTDQGPGLAGKVGKNCLKYALIAEAVWLTMGQMGVVAGGTTPINAGWTGLLTNLGLVKGTSATSKVLGLIGSSLKYGAVFYAATEMYQDVGGAFKGQEIEPEYQGE